MSNIWWTQDYVGDYDMGSKVPDAKCECGMRSVLSKKEDHWERHSDYCPVFKEKKLVPKDIQEEVATLTKGIP